MGWDFSHRDKGTTNEAWFTHELLGDDPETWGTFLATATVKGVFYAAHKQADGEVRGLVVRTQYAKNYYNFGYKAMSENEGPGYYDCPAKVLDLLTPTDVVFANDWRSKCRANIASKASVPKIKHGAVIQFAKPLKFQNGYEGDTFRWAERSVFFLTDGSLLKVRISNWKNRPYTVKAS